MKHFLVLSLFEGGDIFLTIFTVLVIGKRERNTKKQKTLPNGVEPLASRLTVSRSTN